MRARFKSYTRGFSFIEALFALVIVAMVMGALAQTLKQAAMVKTNTANMDHAIEEFHALITIKNDVASALTISSPTSGGSSNQLTFRRVAPSLSLAARTDELEGDPLDPFEPQEQEAVTYQLDKGYLVRYKTLVKDDATTTERMVKCKSFTVSLAGTLPSILTITLEVEGTRVTKARTMKVAVRTL